MLERIEREPRRHPRIAMVIGVVVGLILQFNLLCVMIPERGNMRTILVVEDDTLLGKMICRYCSEAGFEPFWARSGKEAFEALESQQVDAILLDIMLPDMDGFEILKKLREDGTLVKTPVIVLSNLAEMEHIDRALAMGAKDYLIKANVDMTSVMGKLRGLVG